MNPYLATAIAMCAIVLISLAGTAYLAMVFNRKAKVDLQERLGPLAQAIDGAVDVEDAKVEGRYRGQIAIGRMVQRFPALRLDAAPTRGGRARFRGFLKLPAAIRS